MYSMNSTPYEPLGIKLKKMREQQSESLAEVSGAVEIDIDDLARIEAGHDRPSEDILLLLINHFDVQDHEAVRLWEMAGYEEPRGEHQGPTLSKQATVLIVGVDVRTMYTDSAQITTNNSGVVLQFSQIGNEGQPIPVSKVGMSYDQAEQVLKIMQTALLQAKYMRGPKQLPSGE